MKKYGIFFCFVCLFLPASLFAKVESWYIYMGAGYSHTMYDGALKDTTSAMDKQFAFNWDMVHCYFTIADSFILGPALNAVADIYNIKDPYTSETDSVYVFQYFFGPSCMFFPGGEADGGFFLRAEAGLSRTVLSYNNDESSEQRYEGSNWGSGWGFLLGGGYSFPITEGTRLLATLGYAYKQSESVEGDMLKSSSLNATFGVLW